MKSLNLVLCFVILSWSYSAFAVEGVDPCKVIAEEIIPLRVPGFDQSAIWKKISGVKGADRPRALLPVVDGGQIVIGTSIAYDEKKGLSNPQIQILRTDKTGKVIVEKWIDIKNLKTVTDAVLLKDRIVVLAGLESNKSHSIGLSFLNGAGELRTTEIISDPKLDLIPKSMMTVPGKSEMIIAAEAISRQNPEDSYSVLIWVDKDGKKRFQKEYLPGVKNKPEFIGRLSGHEMVMTGRVRTTDGNRDAGWVLRLSNKGDILYQRPYARGGDSVIRRSAASGHNGSMVVIGDALPSISGSKAAWVMKLDPDGSPVWQKYLTGQYGYSGLDVIALPDGRYNVLLAGKPTDHGGRQYVRVVTFSDAGVIIADESFIEGVNAIPVRLIEQNGNRFLLGLAETGFSKEDAPEDLKYIAYDTWLLGLSKLPAFNNICTGAAARSLDDLP